jgi:hypothetical protein
MSGLRGYQEAMEQFYAELRHETRLMEAKRSFLNTVHRRAQILHEVGLDPGEQLQLDSTAFREYRDRRNRANNYVRERALLMGKSQREAAVKNGIVRMKYLTEIARLGQWSFRSLMLNTRSVFRFGPEKSASRVSNVTSAA